ncbi:MKI67 FHA domain-interacting nucleolar phosphoprotein-like [Geodia barretti]|uniref:MKI67 FHA domain-interacting nucleolar phosphoprotein-like n=1 Tax=Geodia barretti TaxID=519541 RepID=A0AA35XER7_GEOBA|nr:MKI67 FHA domain-interacting nucleolar phosphoprotein-like [Geodia barretti]
MEEGDKVVDCAFTERAKKKVKQQKKAVRRGGEDEKDEEAHEELPPPRERGVIYLGHIPYGFFEDEMRSYFSQFGTVTRLKLYRSRKTGRSRGYAFVEFAFPEVAQIAAESMNNYLMCNKLLKCHVVEPEKVGKRMLTPDRRVDIKRKNSERGTENSQQTSNGVGSAEEVTRSVSREQRKRGEELAELGLDYQFTGYRRLCDTTATAKTSTHIIFADEGAEEEEDEGSEKELIIEGAESE